MSEPQEEHDTDDAGEPSSPQPTPGPWDFSAQRGEPGNCYNAQVWGPDGDNIATIESTAPQFNATANARLIAAAGTAAQEAAEMGYDPVAAVEALPKSLKRVHDAIIDLQEAHTPGKAEDAEEAAVQAATHRLKVILAMCGADETMIPGDASVALEVAEGHQSALASAEEGE